MAQTAAVLPQALEAGGCQRRHAEPKSVTVAEIDDWFRAYVDTDRRNTALPEVGTDVELPCDLATALELWAAWDKGVMPRAGGYLQQPRWWRDLMRFLNSRHAPISTAHWVSKDDKHGQQDDTTNWIESGDDVGEPLSFDRLRS